MAKWAQGHQECENVMCNGNIGAGLRSMICEIFKLVKLCLVHQSKKMVNKNLFKYWGRWGL